MKLDVNKRLDKKRALITQNQMRTIYKDKRSVVSSTIVLQTENLATTSIHSKQPASTGFVPNTYK